MVPQSLLDALDDLCARDLLAFQVLSGKVVVDLSDGFSQALHGVLDLAGYRVGHLRIGFQEVHHAREVGLCSDRYMDRDQVPAEPLLERGHGGIEAGILAVQLGDVNDGGQVTRLGESPHLARSDLHAGLARDDEDSRVRDADAGHDLAPEVGVARRVDDVDLVPAPGRVQNRGVDAGASALFLRLEVRRSCAVLNGAQAGRDARSMEHRFGQYSLARSTMRQKDDISDPLSGDVDHAVTPSSGFLARVHSIETE